MKPQKIGRTLGIGVRVAGKVLSSSFEGSSANAGDNAGTGNEAARVSQDATTQMQVATTQVRAVAAKTRSELVGKAGRGVGGFLRPFARIGGILWLEVTGAIFLLVALFIGENLWQVRDSYASGPNHQKFLLIAALLVLFLYLSISAFWRARRR
jgi:hypothetical protein